MTAPGFLSSAWLLVVTVNLVALAMFLGRVYAPRWGERFGIVTLLLGLPALVLGTVGAVAGVSPARWAFPLVDAAFVLVSTTLDLVLKVEVRPPRRPAILVRSPLLFCVPLVAMWGMTWDLGPAHFAPAGLSYAATVGASFSALARGVG